MDKLHDRALEVARQTLAPDPEFPELIELARQLLEATLRKNSPGSIPMAPPLYIGWSAVESYIEEKESRSATGGCRRVGRHARQARGDKFTRRRSRDQVHPRREPSPAQSDDPVPG